MSWETSGTFEPRDYCVQYRESDFQFASRLMEEEGILLLLQAFRRSRTRWCSPTLRNRIPMCRETSKIIYEEVEGGTREEERIIRWEKMQELRSGKYTLWDHCFELPDKHLEAEKTILETVTVGKVTHKLKVGGNDKLEIYDFPGGYAQRFDGIESGGGDSASDLQKDFRRQRAHRWHPHAAGDAAGSLVIDGESNCRHLVSGYKFTLTRALQRRRAVRRHVDQPRRPARQSAPARRRPRSLTTATVHLHSVRHCRFVRRA